MGLYNCYQFPKYISTKISRNIFRKAIINRIKYLRYKWIGYQQWSHLSFGTFGSPAGSSCTKIFKMKKSLQPEINEITKISSIFNVKGLYKALWNH